MAENNNPSTISPTGIALEMPVKIAGPDMDVLEWAKKHIEIPAMRAELSGLFDCSQRDSPLKRVRQVERKTELACTDFSRKKGSRGVLADRANRAIFARLDREMVRLRLVIDDLRYRLEDIEAGRRSR